jgi:hypothetical protein
LDEPVPHINDILTGEKIMRTLRLTSSLKLQRTRRVITLVLIHALVLITLIGGRTPFTPTAQAQTYICGGTNSNRIFQGCPLGDPNYEMSLENKALDELLDVHQLPPTDRGRLMGWERGELRAHIYGQLLNVIKKAPGARTDVEKAALNTLAERVKSKRVEAAQFAVDEYNKWKNNSCGYKPPSGFNYPGAALCAGAQPHLAFFETSARSLFSDGARRGDFHSPRDGDISADRKSLHPNRRRKLSGRRCFKRNRRCARRYYRNRRKRNR